jgi:hypothetical protein
MLFKCFVIFLFSWDFQPLQRTGIAAGVEFIARPAPELLLNKDLKVQDKN